MRFSFGLFITFLGHFSSFVAPIFFAARISFAMTFGLLILSSDYRDSATAHGCECECAHSLYTVQMK